MGAAIELPAGVDLSEAIRTNHRTYNRMHDQYQQTGHARLGQAKRWLKPVFDEFVLRESRTLLELGSADGYLTGYLTDLIPHVTAIDFAEHMCDATRRQAPRAQVVEGEFLDHEFRTTFDVILVSAFAHLFPAPWDRAVLRKVRSLLTSTGIAYLATTLHPEHDEGYLAKNVDGIRWRTRYTPQSFESLIHNSGLSIESFYVTRDRLSPEKTWGNWIVVDGGAR